MTFISLALCPLLLYLCCLSNVLTHSLGLSTKLLAQKAKLLTINISANTKKSFIRVEYGAALKDYFMMRLFLGFMRKAQQPHITKMLVARFSNVLQYTKTQ